MVKRTVLVLVAVAMWGCGGNGDDEPGPVNQVTGVDVKDSAFGTFTTPLGPAVLVGLTEQAGACELAKTPLLPKSSAALTFAVGRSDQGAAGPGEYTVWDPFSGTPQPARYAIVRFWRNDETCTNTLTQAQSTATNGTVKVEAINATAGGRATGSFDIGLASGDRVTGQFDAAQCELPEDLVSRTPTCP